MDSGWDGRYLPPNGCLELPVEIKASQVPVPDQLVVSAPGESM